tara:strand:+ start:47 stop:334 length:288 start_codon:yes stop_codon:yes gene_type:complete
MKVKRLGKKLKAKEELFKIFEGESNIGDFEGDTTFEGLRILSWYTENLVVATKKDILCSENVSVLIEAGITDVDARDLRNLNWSIEDGEYLYCFV